MNNVSVLTYCLRLCKYIQYAYELVSFCVFFDCFYSVHVLMM